MPCSHKFIEDLNLDKVDFEPTTLIVGTFNPAWPQTNTAPWFYGRTKNNYFWDVLPRLYGEQSLLNANPKEWKMFCKRHKIAITDLISCINDAQTPEHDKAMDGYSDEKIASDFKEHSFTPIIPLLEKYSGIKNVYLTRGSSPTFWAKLWRPVKQFCESKGLKEDTLLTPSGYAFYQHGRYNKNNPQQHIASLPDFILKSWQIKWHQTEVYDG